MTALLAEHGPAAVDDEALARRPAACRRGKIDGDAGKVIDLADAAERASPSRPRRALAGHPTAPWRNGS